MTPLHAPVLVAETMAVLAPARGGLFVDCTVGLGGHSRALLEAGAGRVLGLDRDREALRLAADALAGFGDRVELVHADYRDLDRVLDARGIPQVDGALADLGISSMQLAGDGRGFSFQRDEPLDMRMDQSSGASAADLLATVEEEELANVIFRFGEERHSRRIARAITRARTQAAVATTGQLAQIVRRAIPGAATSESIRRRGRSRRSGSGSIASSTAWMSSSPPRRRGSRPGRGSRSSPFTRSRIASSSTRSAPWPREKQRFAS